jgi:aminocarboxymuconate-semialdehyde decarboxylase
MNIDLHFHHLPAFFVEELRDKNPWGKTIEPGAAGEVLRVGNARIALGREHWDVEETLRLMDARRIDVAAISPSPLLFHFHLEASLVLPLHRRINDHLARLAREHPKRFAPLGTLPMQDPAMALAELERCMEIGLKGVEIETNIAGRNLDAPELRPVFRRAAQLGAVVFLHPLAVLGQDRLRSWYLSNLIGNPTDTAVAVASLIFGGVLDDAPDLNVVCAHGGGTTACLCGRWDHGWRVRPELRALPRAPSEYLRRLHYDTLTHSTPMLNLLLDVVGADRLVLGSDFPYDMGNTSVVEAIETHPRLKPSERTQILGENARKLLRLI